MSTTKKVIVQYDYDAETPEELTIREGVCNQQLAARLVSCY
jgi:hypothetical protein